MVKRRSPMYRAWCTMVARCYNPKNISYRRYGGRGVRVWRQWLTFERFLADMGHRPSSGHSIHRINNDGDYEPGNCKWATAKEQARNRRNNRFLEFKGQRASLVEWSEISGINQRTLETRLNRAWTVERTLTQPVRKNHGAFKK